MRKKSEIKTVHGFWINSPTLQLMCPECTSWLEYHNYSDIIPFDDIHKGNLICVHCGTKLKVEIQ